jgi:hypothetical protein
MANSNNQRGSVRALAAAKSCSRAGLAGNAGAALAIAENVKTGLKMLFIIISNGRNQPPWDLQTTLIKSLENIVTCPNVVSPPCGLMLKPGAITAEVDRAPSAFLIYTTGY